MLLWCLRVVQKAASKKKMLKMGQASGSRCDRMQTYGHQKWMGRQQNLLQSKKMRRRLKPQKNDTMLAETMRQHKRAVISRMRPLSLGHHLISRWRRRWPERWQEKQRPSRDTKRSSWLAEWVALLMQHNVQTRCYQQATMRRSKESKCKSLGNLEKTWSLQLKTSETMSSTKVQRHREPSNTASNHNEQFEG